MHKYYHRQQPYFKLMIDRVDVHVANLQKYTVVSHTYFYDESPSTATKEKSISIPTAPNVAGIIDACPDFGMSRFQIPDSRFAIPDSRFPIPTPDARRPDISRHVSR